MYMYHIHVCIAIHLSRYIHEPCMLNHEKGISVCVSQTHVKTHSPKLITPFLNLPRREKGFYSQLTSSLLHNLHIRSSGKSNPV